MNQELINQYKKALKYHNNKIEIRIIHNKEDLCFTIYQREYMNAIRKCFNRSKEEHYAYYNEHLQSQQTGVHQKQTFYFRP